MYFVIWNMKINELFVDCMFFPHWSLKFMLNIAWKRQWWLSGFAQWFNTISWVLIIVRFITWTAFKCFFRTRIGLLYWIELDRNYLIYSSLDICFLFKENDDQMSISGIFYWCFSRTQATFIQTVKLGATKNFCIYSDEGKTGRIIHPLIHYYFSTVMRRFVEPDQSNA